MGQENHKTMDSKKVTAWLRQGEGEDEIYMSITTPKEVADMMGIIRREYPEKWKNKDFDLHTEAMKRLEEEA